MNSVKKDHENTTFVNSLTHNTKYYWDLIKDYYHIIMQARFSLFIAIIVVLFVLVPQGKEALIVMMENANDSDFTQLINFITFNFILALMCWYYARTMYFFAFKDEGKRTQDHSKFKRYFPRLLGVSMIVFPAIVVLFTQSIDNTLFWYLLASSLTFLLFVIYRRDIFNLKKIKEIVLVNNQIRELPLHTQVILITFLVINWLLLYLFTVHGQFISVKIGTTAVVMLAMATLVSVGSTLTFLGERKGIPLVFIIVLIAVFTSMLPDNHTIRDTTDKPQFISAKTTIKKHFNQWLEKRKPLADTDTIPVILISAEGGGIRAAYWTAIVLGHLQDVNPKFAEHVYAISGVSGGSLGAAVFNALLSQDDLMAKNSNTSHCDKDNNYFCRSKRILKEDFLAPTVAAMMFPDAFQRFCFICQFKDRAHALETSWENAWDKEWADQPSSQGVFNKPFQDLWSDDIDMKIPQLFLNSTVVETGQRIIATPLDLSKIFDSTFHDALATFAVTNKSLSLSTTVHTSARFTYVSPAGSLQRNDSPHHGKWIKLVDGGYFDNSGATAIKEILNKIVLVKSKLKFYPIVIHISNEPSYPNRTDNGTDSQATILSEILSPVKAIFNVRGGKGHEARLALKNLVENRCITNNVTKNIHCRGTYLHFKLNTPSDKIQLPLGWMLSTKAQKNMDEQLINQKKLVKQINLLLSQ